MYIRIFSKNNTGKRIIMNTSFKEIIPEEMDGNIFKLIGKDWMLITAENGEKVNTMTASWGGAGVLWGKPVCFTFIRPQRYTYEFTEKTDRMTLCFFDGKYRSALSLCGSRSGRDCDKIAEAKLTPIKDEESGAVYFAEANRVLICRKMYSDMLKKECAIDKNLLDFYPSEDFHRMYICEIEKILMK